MTASDRLRFWSSILRILLLLRDLVDGRTAPEQAAPHLREIARLAMAECSFLDTNKEKPDA